MTGFSAAILSFGTAINRYSALLIGFIALLALAVLYFVKSKSGRAKLTYFASHFSRTRALTEKIAACRFASGMSLTLSSGISPEECVKLAAKLIHHGTFSKKLAACKAAVENGQDLSESLLASQIFSGVYARMVSIGSKTGSLDQVMKDIADKCQDEIDLKFTDMIAVLEPTLVIALSLIVGMILLSVMLPLMGIMSGL